MPLPTFVVIGAQNSSRWLRSMLEQDPDIYVAPGEPSFFALPERYAQGLDVYRSAFSGWDGEPAIGDVSPAYLMPGYDPAAVARHIDESLPGIRLVAVLRDPVERLRVAYANSVVRGRIDPEMDLIDYVRSISPKDDPLQLVAAGWYGATLGPYVERFGDRLLVLLADDIAEDPTGSYVAVRRHVSVPDSPPAGFDVSAVFQDRLAPCHDVELAVLATYYKDDIRQLERLLNQSLDRWREAAYRPIAALDT